MSKRKAPKRAPYWLAEKCPPWCRTRHRAHDFLGDRDHSSGWDRSVTLSLMGPRMHDLGKDHGGVMFSKPRVVVWLRQFVRETEPRVRIETETDAGVGQLELTVTEARKLGNALLRAVEIAES